MGRPAIPASPIEVHCFGGLVALFVVVLGVVVVVVFAVPFVLVGVPVLVLLLNCCEAFRKLSGSLAIWLWASGWAFK
jgi:hypothetical protein